jgi:hypothetical protein
VSGQTATEFYNDWLFKTLTIKYGDVYVGLEPDESIPTSNLLVYPNPSPDGLFQILDASPYSISTIFVHDLSGRRIRLPAPSNQIIDLRNTPSGIYIISILRQNGTMDVLNSWCSRKISAAGLSLMCTGSSTCIHTRLQHPLFC